MAFLVGRTLNPKSGVCAYPVQKTVTGREIWAGSGDTGTFCNYYSFEEIKHDNQANENVLIISITHDIVDDVMAYLTENSIAVNTVYIVKGLELGHEVIKDGMQCWSFAAYIAKHFSNRKQSEKNHTTHIFVSAPNALMFALGKFSLNMGVLMLYEHNLGTTKAETYVKSLQLPLKGE